MWNRRRARSKRTSPSVLVLGHGVRAFLTTIRSLGRQGLSVHAGMCEPDDIALTSRYVDRYHRLPPYRGNGRAWLDAVRTLAREYRYDLIIPCNDESAYPVQRHREELAAYCRVYSLAPGTFEIVFDKIESSLLAETLGIAVPTQAEVSSETDAQAVFERFSPPFVVKPPSSFVLEDLQTRREVIHVKSEADAVEAERNCRSWGRALLQAHAKGIGVGVEVVAARGEVLTAFQHVRVHEPPQGGASSYRRSAPISPELMAATRDFIASVDYTGVAMIEFKVDMESGEWVFIEINGRLWGSLPLAVAAGADFPYYLYELLVDGRRDFPEKFDTNLYCRNVLRDLYWISENRKVDTSDRTAHYVPMQQIIGEIGNVALLRERIDSFTLDDPRPGLVEIGEIGGKIRSKASELLRAALFGNFLYRRLKAREVLQGLAEAKDVLFVCQGNICRSPFAERYAEGAGIPGMKFSSAGYFPEAGRRSPSDARAVAEEFGVDLSAHRSVVVSKEMLDRADLVLVFDEKNLARIRDFHAPARKKTKLLGYLLNGARVTIEDPYAQDSAVYRETYRRIKSAVDELQARVSRSMLLERKNN